MVSQHDLTRADAVSVLGSRGRFIGVDAREEKPSASAPKGACRTMRFCGYEKPPRGRLRCAKTFAAIAINS
jgi:hypothetical protein